MVLNSEKIKDMEMEIRILEAEYTRQRLGEMREDFLTQQSWDLDQQSR